MFFFPPEKKNNQSFRAPFFRYTPSSLSCSNAKGAVCRHVWSNSVDEKSDLKHGKRASGTGGRGLFKKSQCEDLFFFFVWLAVVVVERERKKKKTNAPREEKKDPLQRPENLVSTQSNGTRRMVRPLRFSREQSQDQDLLETDRDRANKLSSPPLVFFLFITVVAPTSSARGFEGREKKIISNIFSGTHLRCTKSVLEGRDRALGRVQRRSRVRAISHAGGREGFGCLLILCLFFLMCLFPSSSELERETKKTKKQKTVRGSFLLVFFSFRFCFPVHFSLLSFVFLSLSFFLAKKNQQRAEQSRTEHIENK